jgi:hypothetical protein
MGPMEGHNRRNATFVSTAPSPPPKPTSICIRASHMRRAVANPLPFTPPHPTTLLPGGVHGDPTRSLPCALSGHRGSGVAWFPGFHPGLSPFAPLGHEHDQPEAVHGHTPQPGAPIRPCGSRWSRVGFLGSSGRSGGGSGKGTRRGRRGHRRRRPSWRRNWWR